MRRFIGVAAVAAALVLTGSAAAATYDIYAGEQEFPPPAGVPAGASLNAFFPGRLTIHAGDRVRVSSATFHTATFGPVAKTAPLVPFIPDPAGGTYADTPDDSAGNPWFFESLGKFIYNPGLFAPSGDNVVDDKQVHNSGAFGGDEQGNPGKVTFRFPKPGSYRLVCLLHPGMEGRVVVKPRRAKNVASPAQARARANAQIAAAWERAKALDDVDVPANTVFMGVGGKETLFGFLPSSLEVPAGTVVEFVTEAPSEVHNALFPNPEGLPWLRDFLAATNFEPAGPAAPNQVQPFFIYGSDPAGDDGVYTFAGATQHGNGVFATPLADDQPGDPPNGLAHSYRVRFTQPGTYDFICQLHPFMTGEIVVTPAS